MKPDQLAKECARVMWADDRAAQHLGIEIVNVAPGEAQLAMQISDTMVNGHGVAHGGFIFALADTAFAYACNSYNNRVVAQFCCINFILPGQLGDELTARAVEVSRAKRSGIYDVTISRADGAIIAAFRGNSRVIKGELLALDANKNQ